MWERAGCGGGGRGGDRTHNPELRRLVLYPIELLARSVSVTIVAGALRKREFLRGRSGGFSSASVAK